MMSAKNRNQAGFTLIELMIAMLLGLLLIAAVAALSVNASRSYKALSRAGELLDNGRFALTRLRMDLEQAGFYGVYEPPSELGGQELTDPCDITPAELAKSFLYPVVDFDEPALPVSSCALSSRRLSGTGSMVVRRADTCGVKRPCPLTIEAAEEDEASPQSLVHLLAKPGLGCFKKRESADNSCQLALSDYPDIRKYQVSLYFICQDATVSGDGIPSLVVRHPAEEQVTDPTETSPCDYPAIVEGIEDIQFQYGIDSDNNGSPDLYKPTLTDSSLPTLDEWRSVVAVRISVLARSTESDNGWVDTEIYNLGTKEVGPFEDTFHRQAFSQVVTLPNIYFRRQ